MLKSFWIEDTFDNCGQSLTNALRGYRLCLSALKLVLFCYLRNLQQPDQAQIRKNCLAEWKVHITLLVCM